MDELRVLESRVFESGSKSRVSKLMEEQKELQMDELRVLEMGWKLRVSESMVFESGWKLRVLKLMEEQKEKQKEL